EREIAEAEEEIAEGENELKEYEQELEDLDDCRWYVLSREANMGYASFTADADRMASIATVFPLLFFLVAALVALTTMTRMVDEERGIIGTYKALGYSNARIMSKYLLYALWATIFGALLGISAGFYTLPAVCWNSYLLVYTAPRLIQIYHINYALQAFLASSLCTLGATYSACRSLLKEWPSRLMLPKAPPMGKRIFLERLGFLWKRFSFIGKVTFRNIFRYKKRLIMALVGIAGCTGLMLTGFGIKDSISAILDKQFEEIYLYDSTITLKDSELSERSSAALEADFSDYIFLMNKTVELSAGGTTLQGCYITVPESAADLEDYIVLRTRTGGEKVEFTESSVVITEKAARELGLKIGDTVEVKEGEDKTLYFVISGICENYVQHYLYIAPSVYESAANEAAEMNTIIARSNAASTAERDADAKELLDYAEFSTVSFSEDVISQYSDMIKSLDYITLVLIFCAGALAFVVLYNLTNINISERIRELATIKVLGFFNGELAAYIFRETALLTLMGGLIGLGAGVIMHAFVITTVEVDMVMFGRNIEPLSFVYSFLLTWVFTAIVDLFMYRKLKSIDMVESLKSID
ncbi:MAG: ABC transporter permease, partial [Oscillospiraceae bacterium]|nr:ABC transporter permease [Oscillospiraceae bacterium]